MTQQTRVDRDSNGTRSFVFRNSGAGPASNDLVSTGYADVAGAKSPYKVDATAGTQRFYRLRQ